MKADNRAVLKAAYKRAILGGIAGAAMGLIFHGVGAVASYTVLGIPIGTPVIVFFPLTIAAFALLGAVMGAIVGGWVKHCENQKNNRIFNRKISYDSTE